MEKENNQVKSIAYEFAVKSKLVCRAIEKNDREYNMTDQLSRSSSSIGANLAEAEHAASRADFLNKLNIALKEAVESQYWLNLLHDTNYLSSELFLELNKLVTSVINMLSASVKTLKKSMNRNN